MRKKNNLDTRLLSCGGFLTLADLDEKNMSLAAEVKDYIDFEKVFGNSNPVCLEIGCGKGKFVCEKAAQNPDINFIAIEKISNVLIAAVERAKSENLKNVHFINCAAEVLPKYIPDGKIAKIYLNFSNPLPKEGYKKQRLTHPKFLALYARLLSDGGEIEQKTDDKPFFGFSLESYKLAGYKVLDVREDLAANPVAGDVETEHEAKFKAEGKNIYYIKAQK